MEREHLVPLSAQAAHLLVRRREASRDTFVFPGDKPGLPMSENTMIFACYRMGYRGRQTIHGFRGLGSTWANEAECYRPDWVEMALAHVDEDEVRGAYNSALYLTPRRRMLQHWADEIFGVSTKIGPRPAGSRPPGPPPVPVERAWSKRLPPVDERCPYWQRSQERTILSGPRRST